MSTEITVPGSLDSLEKIRRFVTEQAEGASLDRKAAYKLVLAIDEIATNIISYGYIKNGLEGDINIIAEVTDSELIVILEDSAPPYDPREREAKAASKVTQPLADRELGGWGIFLAVNGVDRFEYEYANKRNRNTFAIRR